MPDNSRTRPSKKDKSKLTYDPLDYPRTLQNLIDNPDLPIGSDLGFGFKVQRRDPRQPPDHYSHPAIDLPRLEYNNEYTKYFDEFEKSYKSMLNTRDNIRPHNTFLSEEEFTKNLFEADETHTQMSSKLIEQEGRDLDKLLYAYGLLDSEPVGAMKPTEFAEAAELLYDQTQGKLYPQRHKYTHQVSPEYYDNFKRRQKEHAERRRQKWIVHYRDLLKKGLFPEDAYTRMLDVREEKPDTTQIQRPDPNQKVKL